MPANYIWARPDKNVPGFFIFPIKLLKYLASAKHFPNSEPTLHTDSHATAGLRFLKLGVRKGVLIVENLEDSRGEENFQGPGNFELYSCNKLTKQKLLKHANNCKTASLTVVWYHA